MSTPNWEAFGREVFAGVAERCADEIMGEGDEDILELAVKHGIAQEVAYDPAIHGEIEEAEPGALIWFWGKRKEGA